MGVLGLILGILLGGIIGAIDDSPYIGMMLGAPLGCALLMHVGKEARITRAMEEIEQLRQMLQNQHKIFDRDMAALRARIFDLEHQKIPTGDTPSAPASTSASSSPAPISEPFAFDSLVLEPIEQTQNLEPAPVLADIQPEAIVPVPVQTQTEENTSAVSVEEAPVPTSPSQANPPPRVLHEWKAEPPARITPAQPRAAPEPAWIEQGFGAIRDWLFGGNTLVRMGILLVFLGLAFLLRYASDHIVIPIELRYISVASLALAGLGLGWHLREKRRAFALLMQGGAVAVMYLTIFAAMRLHPLISMQGGFALLVMVAILAAILAISQDALALAMAGSLGGFAAPILASTGSGSHVALFSYFALLNAGILAIAWFKAWRPLNLVGFFCTFMIGLSWGMRAYDPLLHYASTQFFLILFFLMFVIIGLLFARRVLLDDPDSPQGIASYEWLSWVKAQGSDLRRYVDATLLFGTPLAGFGLQYALVQNRQYGAAFSALALGIFYTLLARLVHSRTQAALRLLVEVFLALGVVFVSLAIPLGLDAQWTTAAWALEAAGIYWVGLRQQRSFGRAFALLLQVGAIITWLQSLHPGSNTLLSGSSFGPLLLGLAFLCNAAALRQAQKNPELHYWDASLRPIFNTLGLWFLYLIAPMMFGIQGCAISWSIAGLVTTYVGLRIKARGWLVNSLLVQLLAGAIFLLDIQTHGGLDGLGVLSLDGSSWRGLAIASWLGLAALLSVFFAVRHARLQIDSRMEKHMAWLMLFGLGFVSFAALFIMPWIQATAVWAVCGFIFLALALWLQLKPAFWFALVLQLLSGIAYLLTNVSPLLFVHEDPQAVLAFAHLGFWTPAIMAIATSLVAWRLIAFLESHEDSGIERPIALLALIWSVLWWGFAWGQELYRLLPSQSLGHVFLAVMAGSALAWNFLARRYGWGAAVLLSEITLPFAGLIVLVDYLLGWHPFAHWGGVAFVLVLLNHLATLRQTSLFRVWIEEALHLLGVWAGLLILSLEARHLLLMLSETGSSWRWLGWTLPLLAWLLWSTRSTAAQHWPCEGHTRLYRFSATLPISLILLLWVGLSALGSSGNAAPLPYLPLANPLEIAQILVLFTCWRWLQSQEDDEADLYPASQTFAMLARPLVLGLAFLVYTMLILRADFHLIGDLQWNADSLLASMPVQASLSIAWSLLALGMMIAGHHQGRRLVWILGAILVAIVVAKLFLVELSNRAGVERIISFIGVGILLLIVGYFAPLPPAQEKDKE